MTDAELRRGLKDHRYIAREIGKDEWVIEKEETPEFRSVIHHSATPMKRR